MRPLLGKCLWENSAGNITVDRTMGLDKREEGKRERREKEKEIERERKRKREETQAREKCGLLSRSRLWWRLWWRLKSNIRDTEW